MADNDFLRTAPDEIRLLASRGELAERVGAAAGDERRRLRASVFEIAQPVVFWNLTRALELKRGHYRCATAVHRLEDQCLDRFHDDMDTVVADVLRGARVPITSLEGWIRGRLTHATVDGYRRRRSERGALQRPRVPRWLATALGENPVLLALAVDILDFVGTDTAVGPDTWPIARWAERRVATGADAATAPRVVARETEVVLSAMRRRPGWYADYVERPLGRKRPLAIPLPRFSSENGAELPVDLALRQQESDPMLWRAALAVAAIDSGIADGEVPEAVVAAVVSVVFDGEPWSAGPDAVDRILAAVTAR
ncbi:hypothetical protein [Actinokineospora globicatena]|uniref:Uncharacterized protein n=1 Tax=Actinokineospora globicatena TaxID=103729 RepID=A0A9W6V662_9PSEU|nr:hypothetical protein [Actinokineospora globicatena]GLW91205.1 hypothetical protein Aglo03_20210 [Actinokineospora globicatena]